MYNLLFKKILYPLYETIFRQRKTLHYLKSLNKSQWLPYSQLKENQWHDLKKLLQHAYDNSPYYHQLFERSGLHPDDINSYEDFQKIPIASREEVVEHNDEMLAENYRGKVSYKTTGGSTGVPVKLAHDRDSYEWRTAAAQRGYQWANCEPGQHTLYIWSGDVGEQPFFASLKTLLYHWFFNRKMINCFNFDNEGMQACIDYINRKAPTGIVAFTMPVYNLAKYIDENNLPCRGVPSIITGAERLYDYQRELIEKVFQGKVFNTYGCREFMLIAAECEEHQGLHLTMDNLFVEILRDGRPAKPGELGEVVITDLHNFGMPFIRYKNGDVAVQSDKTCACGRSLPLIEGIEGRILDVITAYDGKAVTGAFFPHLMKEISGIKKYQVIQKTKEHLIVKIVQANEIGRERLDFCKREIRKVFGEEVRVEFDFVDEIPLSPSGKFRMTISEVPVELS